MTDNDIIKALECCMDEMGCTKGCPCFNPKSKGSPCTISKKLELEKLTLDLINRQKAEIERLQKENNQFADIGKMYSEIKAEAVKEFVEWLDSLFTDGREYTTISKVLVYRKYKEMMGEGHEE